MLRSLFEMATDNSFSYNIYRESSFESTFSFVKPETSIFTACMWKNFITL